MRKFLKYLDDHSGWSLLIFMLGALTGIFVHGYTTGTLLA